MWEKITKYKLSLKKNLIYEFCQEAYKESSNFDVVSEFIFVSSNLSSISLIIVLHYIRQVQYSCAPNHPCTHQRIDKKLRV